VARALKGAFFRRAISYSAQHARVLICVSAFSARLLEEIGALPTRRSSSHRWASNSTRFNRTALATTNCSNATHCAEVPNYVFFVGTVEPRKGLDVLLAAFRRGSRGRRRRRAVASRTGRVGHRPIEEQIATHPYATRIRRLGFVDDDVASGAVSPGSSGRLPLAGRGIWAAGPRGDGLWGHGRDHGRRR
jgi:glycosyltransferase involved in cell wall biosynthesis